MKLLTTRFKRFLRRVIEKLLDQFYEGPTPPKRIGQGARALATLNPNATVDEWMQFATAHAESAYRSGHVRGLEWAERDLDRRDPITDPEHLLDQRRHDWSWVDMSPDPEILQRRVSGDPYENFSPEQRVLAIDSLGRYFGGYRVVVDPRKDPKQR